MIACARAEEFLSSLGDESIDMVLTSPPYDGMRDYEGNSGVDMFSVGREVARALVPGGVAVVVTQDQTLRGWKSLTSFRTAVDWVDGSGGELGLFECLLYGRPGVPGGWWNRRFRVDHEYVLVFVRGRRPAHFDKDHMMLPTKWAGTARRRVSVGTDGKRVYTDEARRVNPLKCPGTILPYNPTKCEGATLDVKIKRKHPATFPDRLAEDMIRCFCPPGGLVVDPMVGSGTTVVAAIRSGRRALGCDIGRQYCRVAADRVRLVRWLL